MYTLKVTLKQHTPLIHFQHDQEGATLRASEVKPKLDKFVINKLTQEELTSWKRDGWLKSKNSKIWLDYRMRIEADGLKEPIDPNAIIGYKQNGNPIFRRSPMFFANMGDTTILKYYSQCEKCRLTISTSSSILRDKLAEYVGDFFIQNNFGTRQSKGYGSFSVLTSQPQTTVHSKKLLYFTVSGNINQLFEEMEWFHKAIRGGINDCFGDRLYFKSLMFSFAKYRGQQWEKKTIKLRYYPAILESQKSAHNDSELLLYRDNKFDKRQTFFSFRDCLGLSSLENWRNPYKKTIKKESDRIERFKSPITFKPVYIEKEQKWKVYILWQELPKDYLGATFKVTSNNDGDLELIIPNDFKIKDYLDYIFKRKNDGTYSIDISSLFLVRENKRKMKEIIRIFDELRKNYNL